MQPARGPVKVKQRHLSCEGRRRCGFCMLLRHGARRAGRDLVHRGQQCFCACFGNARKQLARRFVLADLQRLHAQKIARIQPFVQIHDGNARLFVTVDHGPLHGRGAPIARQQRNVQIDAPARRDGQHLRRQNAAVGHYNNQLGRQCADLFGRAVPQRLRLKHRQPVRQRRLLHRRRR